MKIVKYLFILVISILFDSKVESQNLLPDGDFEKIRASYFFKKKRENWLDSSVFDWRASNKIFNQGYYYHVLDTFSIYTKIRYENRHHGRLLPYRGDGMVKYNYGISGLYNYVTSPIKYYQNISIQRGNDYDCIFTRLIQKVKKDSLYTISYRQYKEYSMNDYFYTTPYNSFNFYHSAIFSNTSIWLETDSLTPAYSARNKKPECLDTNSNVWGRWELVIREFKADTDYNYLTYNGIINQYSLPLKQNPSRGLSKFAANQIYLDDIKLLRKEEYLRTTPDTQICDGDAIEIAVTSGNGPYSWTNMNTNQFITNNAKITIQPTENTRYRVASPYDTSFVDVSVFGARFNKTITKYHAYITDTFNIPARFTGDNMRYQWYNGDTTYHTVTLKKDKNIYCNYIISPHCIQTDSFKMISLYEMDTQQKFYICNNDSIVIDFSFQSVNFSFYSTEYDTLNQYIRPNTYRWLWNDGVTGDVLKRAYKQAGKYWVDIQDNYFVRRLYFEIIKDSFGVSIPNDTTLCKYSQNLIPVVKGFSSPLSYKWQDGTTAAQYTATKNGLYKVTVSSGSCIDSAKIQVNLEPNKSDTLKVIVCKSYKFGDSTYTKSGTYTHKFRSASGCDSFSTLVLDSKGVHAQVKVDGNNFVALYPNGTYQWYICNPSWRLISGANQQVFSTTTQLKYAVIVSDKGCVDTSACIDKNYSGISLSDSKEIQIYPNPFTNFINIKFENNIKDNQIEIYNSIGQKIKSFATKSTEFQVDLTNEAKGVYLIKVNETQIFKMLKL